ncbi:MAG: hypothetical protein ACYC35_01435 [Pirellulales bacterium]
MSQLPERYQEVLPCKCGKAIVIEDRLVKQQDGSFRRVVHALDPMDGADLSECPNCHVDLAPTKETHQRHLDGLGKPS